MHKPAVFGSDTDDRSWHLHAACRGMDTDLFYSADFARGAPKRNQEAAAKAICATCPVIQQCLSRALQVGEPHGVWGGLNSDERDALIDADSIAVA